MVDIDAAPPRLQGWLNKRATSGVMRTLGQYTRRFFVVEANGVLAYYETDKQAPAYLKGRVVFTAGTQVRENVGPGTFPFTVKTARVELNLQADTAEARAEWLRVLTLHADHVNLHGPGEVPADPRPARAAPAAPVAVLAPSAAPVQAAGPAPVRVPVAAPVPAPAPVPVPMAAPVPAPVAAPVPVPMAGGGGLGGLMGALAGGGGGGGRGGGGGGLGGLMGALAGGGGGGPAGGLGGLGKLMGAMQDGSFQAGIQNMVAQAQAIQDERNAALERMGFAQELYFQIKLDEGVERETESNNTPGQHGIRYKSVHQTISGMWSSFSRLALEPPASAWAEVVRINQNMMQSAAASNNVFGMRVTVGCRNEVRVDRDYLSPELLEALPPWLIVPRSPEEMRAAEEAAAAAAAVAAPVAAPAPAPAPAPGAQAPPRPPVPPVEDLDS